MNDVYFINSDQWQEIYMKARENGYSLTNFLVETMRRSLSYPHYEPTRDQILHKLEVLEEDILYRLVMNPRIWPEV